MPTNDAVATFEEKTFLEEQDGFDQVVQDLETDGDRQRVLVLQSEWQALYDQAGEETDEKGEDTSFHHAGKKKNGNMSGSDATELFWKLHNEKLVCVGLLRYIQW